jgi:predicted acylesterase/phospholipase RssA
MPVGLALSGGGLRATLFHLGVVRALRDAGVLKDVAHVCSVSGGSILAAHLILHWEDYLGDGFDARSQELLDFCRWDVRNRIVRRYPNLVARWIAAGVVPFGLVDVRGPTDLLRRSYRRLYGDATLEQLRGEPGRPRPALHLLTTNVTTGTLCSFGADGFVSEADAALGRNGREWLRIPAVTPSLAFAVAASSAFPGMFSPLRLTAEELGKYDAPLQPPEQFITDGGVYDNLGVRKFLNDPAGLDRLDRVFVSNASLELRVAGRDGVGLLKTALRASDLLGHRVHQLEAESMERAADGKLVPIRIRDVVPRAEEPAALHENTQEWLRWIRTDLDRFSPFEQHCLIRHGWTLARRAIRTSGLAPGPARPWDPIPSAEIPETPVRQVALLSKSVLRRARLVDLRDPLSWFHLALLAGLAALALWRLWR